MCLWTRRRLNHAYTNNNKLFQTYISDVKVSQSGDVGGERLTLNAERSSGEDLFRWSGLSRMNASRAGRVMLTVATASLMIMLAESCFQVRGFVN